MRRFRVQQPESLEPRRVLAASYTITDFDGDLVTIRSSRGTNLDLVGSITSFPSPLGSGEQIQRVDLSAPVFAGTKLQISVTQRAFGADGLVNIGEIFSPHDLTSVTVDGDLTKITVGDGNTATPGIGRLSLGSMGMFSSWTGAPDTISFVSGAIRSLQVSSDMLGVSLAATGAVGNAVIGGSIIGVNPYDGVSAASIGTMTVAGNLEGGGADLSGSIMATSGAIRSLRIGAIIGGAGLSSGLVSAVTQIKDIRVNGSVVGGLGPGSGAIYAGASGGIGKLVITGSILGGSSDDTGIVLTAGRIKSAAIGGDLVGNTGARSGSIEAQGGIDSMRIAGGVVGGSNSGSGTVTAGNASIRRLDVGSISGGTGPLSGSITAGNLGSVTIRGNVLGTPLQPVLISALGTTGRAIGSLTVRGSVENAQVLAGYSFDTPSNGNARIGDVVIGGNLVASSIAAGIENLRGTGRFGDFNDVPIGGAGTSRIDSVTVGGVAFGNGNLGIDTFGIAAMTIGRVRIGGTRYPITPGLPVSPFGDNFAIHDLA